MFLQKRHSGIFKMKKIVLILCSMISGITLVFAENTAYLCRKCAVYTVTDHTPVSKNCNASGFHIWTKLAPVGEKVFLCRKCRITAYVSRKPSCISCPASGSHQWSFLGKNGREHYQCRKCRVQVKTATRPSSFGCPASGSHQWNQF